MQALESLRKREELERLLTRRLKRNKLLPWRKKESLRRKKSLVKRIKEIFFLDFKGKDFKYLNNNKKESLVDLLKLSLECKGKKCKSIVKLKICIKEISSFKEEKVTNSKKGWFKKTELKWRI